MGNPHAVAFVDDLADAGAAARRRPTTTRRSTPTASTSSSSYAAATRHVAMRVHERGSGETRSCGTGACAVMVAAARRRRAPSGRRDLPGRRARRHAHGHLDRGRPGAAHRAGRHRGPRRRPRSERPLRCPAHGHHRILCHRHRRRLGHRRRRRPPARRQGRDRRRRRPAGRQGRGARRRRSAASFAQVDVTDTEQITAAVRKAAEIAPLRVLVNSAGIGWAQRTIGRDGQFESAHDLGAFTKVDRDQPDRHLRHGPARPPRR